MDAIDDADRPDDGAAGDGSTPARARPARPSPVARSTNGAADPRDEVLSRRPASLANGASAKRRPHAPPSTGSVIDPTSLPDASHLASTNGTNGSRSRGDITSEIALLAPLEPPPIAPVRTGMPRTKPISGATPTMRGRPQRTPSDDVIHLAPDPDVDAARVNGTTTDATAAATNTNATSASPAAFAPVPLPLVRQPPDVDDFNPPHVVYNEPEPEEEEMSALRRVVRLSPAGRRTRRPRIRRVTRVVRHVDPWSVFKVALCFSMVLYGVCLTAGVLLWNVAYTTGTIDNVERFFESFGWNSFKFNGGQLYHNAWVAGLFAAVGLTGLMVLAATLFNLITDLVGGIRVTVLEEEVVERNPAAARQLLRRRSTEMFRIQGRQPRPADDDEDGYAPPPTTNPYPRP